MSRFTKKTNLVNFQLTSTKLFAGMRDRSAASYEQDPVMRLPLIFSGLTILFSAILLALTFKRLPPEIPLYYSRPWGEARLTVRYNLWFLPLISIVILGLNTFLSRRCYRSDPLLAQLLMLSSGLAIFLLTLTLIQILRLVSS